MARGPTFLLLAALFGPAAAIAAPAELPPWQPSVTAPEPGAAAAAEREISHLTLRSRLIYHAIFFSVLAALLVCLVVAGAFLGALLAVDLARTVATLFIGAMLAMIVGLSLFLRVVFLAVRMGARNQP